MEKLTSTGCAYLVLRWSHKTTAHPRPALLPSLHLLRRIFWTSSDDNHSTWDQSAPLTLRILLSFAFYHVPLNFLMFLSLPVHLQYAVCFTLGIYSVMSEFSPGNVCMTLCLRYRRQLGNEMIGDHIRILFKRIPLN